MTRLKTTHKAASNGTKTKGPSEDKLKKQAENARTPALTYTKSVAQELGLEGMKLRTQVIMGNIKETEAILRKAHNDYGGDLEQVNDVCRLMIEVDGASDLEDADTLFFGKNRKSHPFNRKTAKSGKFEITKRKNYLQSPKRWGWIGIQLKMRAKLSNGQWAKFELQIVPKCMKEAYKKTHALYEQIRTKLEQWEQLRCDIKDILTPEELKIAQEILDTHEQAAIAGGIDHIYDRFPKLDDPWPLEKEDNVADVSAEYVTFDLNPQNDEWWAQEDPYAALEADNS